MATAAGRDGLVDPIGRAVRVVITLALFWGGPATLFCLVDHWVLRGVLGTVWAFSLAPVLKRLHLFPKLGVRLRW